MKRDLFKSTIIVSFVLAIFCFLLIFLTTAAENHTIENSVASKVPIQQSQQSVWAQVPGDLDFSLTQEYSLYSFSYEVTDEAQTVALNKLTSESLSMDLSRDYATLSWYPQKSVVTYNEAYKYPEVGATAVDTVRQVNLGAYDVWYQMTHKPQYWKAWQALVLAYNQMINSDMLNRLYAYNAYAYYFNVEQNVQDMLSAQLTASQISTLYNDPDFGLGNFKGLTVWVTAAS